MMINILCFQVMPYGNGPSVKKLSKMSTLLLARNYILTLTKNLEELRFCVTKVCMEQNKPLPNVACLTPIAPVHSGCLDLPAPMAGPVSGIASRPIAPFSGFPTATDRAYIYRSVVPCRDSISHQLGPRREKLTYEGYSDSGNSEMTSSINRRNSLKMKCNSRSGKPCFCVECLTKK